MIQSIVYNVNMDETKDLLNKVKSLENELVMLRFGMVHILQQINDTLRNLEQWQRWQFDQTDIETLRMIRDGLVTAFDESELIDLCFDLGINYEALVGEAFPDKARNLVLHQQRRQRLNDLIEHCKRLRPSHEWPMVL